MDDEEALRAAIDANPGEDVPQLMLADLRQERGDDFGAWVLRANVELTNGLRGVFHAVNGAIQKVADEQFGGNYAACLTALSEFQKGRVGG